MKYLAALFLSLFLLATGPAHAQTSFVDDSAQTVVVKKPFTRIISLYAAHTENLFSMGLDEQIIGVGRSESYPPAALNKPAFSYRDGPERFLAARPDLVLVRPMIYNGYRPLIERLRQAGVSVVSLQPAGAEEIFRYWRRLGLLTGREEQAEGMIREFNNGLAALRQKTAQVPQAKRPRVFFESIHKRMKTFAPDSTAIFLLLAAGGRNAAPDAEAARGTNIANYGKERILALANEIDVYLAQTGPMNRVTVDEIMDEPGFNVIQAIKNRRVYLVDEQLVSRPTLRLLLGGAEIQSLLYPKSTGE